MNFVLSQYIDYALYDFFKNRMHGLVSKDQVFTEGLPASEYLKVFYSPPDSMRNRSAVLSGVSLPLVCFWRDGPPKIAKGFYGVASMPQSFRWADAEDPPVMHESRGRLATYEIEYSLYAESYFLQFINQFSEDMTELDFQRYVEFTFTGYLPTYKTRLEFVLEDHSKTDNVIEETKSRSFMAKAKWKVSFTVPEIRDSIFVDSVLLYLNSKLVDTITGA